MTTPFPTHFNNQIAEKSILDAFNKQVILGNQFDLNLALTLADTSEHPEMLIINPSTSQKSLFMIRRRVSGSAAIYVRMYLGPTITGNGTPATPVNMRPAYATTTAASCYSAPTISVNGTLVTMDNCANFTVQNDNLVVVDPGKTILITAQSLTGSGGTATTGLIEAIWYEL